MSYSGVDIGTSGCKAVVFDKEGTVLASAYREYPTLTPQEGWAELDSNDVCNKCLEVIEETARSCSSDPISGIGISSQGEAFTPIDSKGTVLSGAMVSFDTRASSIARIWSEEFGRERLYQITGHTAHPLFTLFKLLWVRDHQPDIWKKADKFLCFEDLLHTRLGIEPAISWSLAGRTMLFDVRGHKWSDDILNSIGLKKSRLARLLPSGSIVGKVGPKVAAKLGLARDTIVVTGGHDQPCGALGAGVITEGKAMYASGTVECITPAFSSAVFSRELYENNLCTYDYLLDGMYTTVAFSLTGGNILRWFRDEWGEKETVLAGETGRNVYELLLENVGKKPSRLLVLPYFTPTGTPYFDTRTPGAILGLRLTTKRSEVLRALLEGVAYEMRLNLDILENAGIRINELLAVGGGSRSRIWTQLKTDVLHKPITTVDVTEAGCLGVALLAASAHRGQEVKTLVKKWVKTGEPVEPNSENALYYDGRFATYKKLYPAIKKIGLSGEG